MTWHSLAACRGMNPGTFFGPDRPRDDHWADEARAVCALCPARQPCLDEALVRGERYGVWGGMSPSERRQLIKDKGAA